jgi:hypothetical protein
VTRIPLTDPHYLKIDIDQLRGIHPGAASDLIKNPQKYYRIARDHL